MNRELATVTGNLFMPNPHAKGNSENASAKNAGFCHGGVEVCLQKRHFLFANNLVCCECFDDHSASRSL